MKSILVIGAGISGLSFVDHLLNLQGTDTKKFDIEIFEADDNDIGGRIKTIVYNDCIVELGAQFIHGNSDKNSLYKLARELNELYDGKNGLIKNPHFDYLSDEDLVFLKPDGSQVDKYFATDCARRFQEIQQDLESGKFLNSYSARKYIEEKMGNLLDTDDGKKVCERLEIWLQAYLGCELDQVDFENDKYTNTGDDCLARNGLLSICKQLAQPFKQKIKLGKTVKKIKLINSKVQVTCTDNTESMFDHVVVTVSLGVLKKSLIEFQPALPKAKLLAINELGYCTVTKIILFYDKHPVAKEWRRLFLIPPENITETKNRWKYNLILDTDRNGVIFFWLTGPESIECANLSANECGRICTDLIRNYIKDFPEPIKVLRTNFSTDPKFNGCYSYVPKGFNQEQFLDLQQPIISDSLPRILFAGEATDPYTYSTMHGARNSGIREATRIFNDYSKFF